MKQYQGFSGIPIRATVLALIAHQPAWAMAEVTAVRLNPTANGVEVVFDMEGDDRPQVFTVNRGNSAVIDITNTQLRLPEGKSFQKNNPAPGITSVVVSQLDSNSTRVIVSGATQAPNGQVVRRDGSEGLVLGFSQAPGGEGSGKREDERTSASLPPPSKSPNPIPPFLPRAIAPPVGDITVAPIDSTPGFIDLGASGSKPVKLTLREAPAREVLTLLARAAGLNVAFTEQGGGATSATPGAPSSTAAPPGGGGPTISLDIDNEPIQNVLNYVLQIADLEANKVGQTIFVGKQLPDNARNLVARSFRLNQVPVTTAANFLTAQGAETQLPIERVQIQTIGEGAAARTVETREPDIKVLKAQRGEGPLLLAGLSVLADQRLNSITLVGTPRKVEIASAFLTQLDLRRRQVAVNARVIDINLAKINRIGSSFSFGVGDTRVINTGGNTLINFGTSTPAANPVQPDQVGQSVVDAIPPVAAFNFVRNFLVQLQALVTNGDAKILTDPTVVVQEGQKANVNLAQEVVTNIKVEREGDDDNATTTVTIEKADAGLQLEIQVERIDDNGFVALSVLPRVSAPFANQEVALPGTGGSPPTSQQITLLQKRDLNSGLIRVRDGQSLILTGIIQDSERTSVSKVPILGDIPILGRLFKRTDKTRERQELIVVLTPQILDDSDQSSFGYEYKPSPEAEKLLNPNRQDK